MEKLEQHILPHLIPDLTALTLAYLKCTKCKYQTVNTAQQSNTVHCMYHLVESNTGNKHELSCDICCNSNPTNVSIDRQYAYCDNCARSRVTYAFSTTCATMTTTTIATTVTATKATTTSTTTVLCQNYANYINNNRRDVKRCTEHATPFCMRDIYDMRSHIKSDIKCAECKRPTEYGFTCQCGTFRCRTCTAMYTWLGCTDSSSYMIVCRKCNTLCTEQFTNVYILKCQGFNCSSIQVNYTDGVQYYCDFHHKPGNVYISVCAEERCYARCLSPITRCKYHPSNSLFVNPTPDYDD